MIAFTNYDCKEVIVIASVTFLLYQEGDRTGDGGLEDQVSGGIRPQSRPSDRQGVAILAYTHFTKYLLINARAFYTSLFIV